MTTDRGDPSRREGNARVYELLVLPGPQRESLLFSGEDDDEDAVQLSRERSWVSW